MSSHLPLRNTNLGSRPDSRSQSERLGQRKARMNRQSAAAVGLAFPGDIPEASGDQARPGDADDAPLGVSLLEVVVSNEEVKAAVSVGCTPTAVMTVGNSPAVEKGR